jgi:hypothetical protein
MKSRIMRWAGRGRGEECVQYFDGKLHNLYSSPDIIRQSKLRRMRWAGHVARMGEETKVYRFWWESPKERGHLEDQDVVGKMGSEWILGRLAWGVWIGFDCLRTGTGGGLL